MPISMSCSWAAEARALAVLAVLVCPGSLPWPLIPSPAVPARRFKLHGCLGHAALATWLRQPCSNPRGTGWCGGDLGASRGVCAAETDFRNTGTASAVPVGMGAEANSMNPRFHSVLTP